jgi:hypothetical protein
MDRGLDHLLELSGLDAMFFRKLPVSRRRFKSEVQQCSIDDMAE